MNDSNARRCAGIASAAAVALAAFAALRTGSALAGEPTVHDLHAAGCVAALEAHTQDLASQVRAGKDDLRGLLLDRLVAGTAFVGNVYLHSDIGEKQAKALAVQALEAQKHLPEAELIARQSACAAEGTKLFADSNGLQQSVIRHLARKRMNRLLGD